jgi:hypothetical protein
MQPSQSILNQIATLLAGDTTTLANAAALKIHLAKANFTPSPALLLAGLTEADFVGYAALAAGIGAQLNYVDPVTGLVTIEIKPPAGGWHFSVTGITNLPETIYGWYVTDNGTTVLYGSARLVTPIPLTASGQGFDIDLPKFAFLTNSPF